MIHRNNINRKFKTKNNKGSEIISTPIIIALGIILVSTLLVFAIKILTPYIWYEKLSSTCLKYIFVMEEYGYLTKTEKNHLKEELLEQGFEADKLAIDCTEKRKEYGEPIYLDLNYIYTMKLPILGEKPIQMNIKRETVSKR